MWNTRSFGKLRAGPRLFGGEGRRDFCAYFNTSATLRSHQLSRALRSLVHDAVFIDYGHTDRIAACAPVRASRFSASQESIA